MCQQSRTGNVPRSFSIALHFPTRARGICKDFATITYHVHTKLLLTRQKESADMTKKGSLGSCYNHYLSHDLSLQSMTRVQPPLNHTGICTCTYCTTRFREFLQLLTHNYYVPQPILVRETIDQVIHYICGGRENKVCSEVMTCRHYSYHETIIKSRYT